MISVALDCDGVLLDWERGFAKWITETHRIPVNPDGPSSWDLTSWIGCDMVSAITYVREFNRSEEFSLLEAMPGAVAAIQRLRAEGWQCHVITACGEHPTIHEKRLSNLRNRFGADAWTTVQCIDLGKSKRPALYKVQAGSYWVEDSYGNAAEGLTMGLRSMMVRCAHNAAQEKIADRKIPWFDDLGQVVDRILLDSKEAVRP